MSIASILNGKAAGVIRVTPDDPIRGVIQTLGERKIGAVLVMDSGGRMLGILSETRHRAGAGA